MLWSARDDAAGGRGRHQGNADVDALVGAVGADRTRVSIEQAAVRARVARNGLDGERARACRTDTMVAIAGMVGLACIAVPLVAPGWSWTGDAPSMASIAGLCLVALPVIRSVRRAVTRDETAEILLATAAARAGAVVSLGNRLLETLLEARDVLATPATLRLARGMLDAVEVEAEFAATTARDGHARRAVQRHRRIVPKTRKVVVTTCDGRRLIGTIQDVSLSGVAFAEPLPRVGLDDEVAVGQQTARVVRTWERGLAMQFTEPLDPGTFDEWVTL